MHELEIERAFGRQTFQRGKAYFEDGRVLSAMKLGGRVLGKVLGTEEYLTNISIDNLESSCSCPVRENCKHGAALFLQFLGGNYVDGGHIMRNLESADKPELLKILKRLVKENPTLLLNIQENKEEPSDKLKASVEKHIKELLENMLDSGYADEDFAKAFAKLIKTNSTLLDKELIFYMLDFLTKNSEEYGNFYDDYGDYTFGDEIFQNLCDSFAQKTLDAGDFERLQRIEEDGFDMLTSFNWRMVKPENAPKLLPFKRQVRTMLGNDGLYAEFLINAKENQEAKKILTNSRILSESLRIDLYLRIDKDEAIQLAKERKYYSALIWYYHKANMQEQVVATFSNALDEKAELNADASLHGCIFSAIKNVKPADAAELLSQLFKMAYETENYDLCVDVGIELKNLNLLSELASEKTDSYLFTPAAKLKLLKFLSPYEPENAKKSLEAFAEDLIAEKKDFAYENAVKCVAALRGLMDKKEWTEYLKELYVRHYRKISLWSKIRAEGINVKREGNIMVVS